MFSEYTEQCKRGEHPLINILFAESWDCSSVARWCSVCGAIVVDVDVDGRVHPGRHMKMKLPLYLKQCIKEKR